MVAVNWVYQFSIFTFVLAIIQVPYNALLIAREHMNIYAYMSILETVLKLIIVFILVVLDLDKLILYAVLTFFVTFIVNILYKIYCKKHFKESEYVFYYDKNYYKELLSYSGWNLFGSIAVLARGQGGNILLNLFFGPIANAAYGLTIIVQGIISSFVSNFQVAVNPQIIKMYSIGKIDSSINLIYKTAKFSFFGMLILVTPFIMNDDYILRLWLNDVPQYTSEFIKLALIYSMIDCISNPLVTGAQATGKIKWYQITLGILIFLTLPITWVLFKCFRGPFHLFEVLIINSVIALIFRIIFLKKMIGLNLLDFFKNVFARIGLVLMIITIVYKLIPFDKANNVLALMSQTIIIVLTILAVILTFGLSASERKMMKEMLTIKFKLP
jgi:O-antigen/teichoic acid export membrane protein